MRFKNKYNIDNFCKFKNIRIVSPTLGENQSVKMYPKECRERHITYSGKISIKIDYLQDGKLMTSLEKIVGQVPIMVKVRKHFLSLLQLNETNTNSLNDLSYKSLF